MTDSSTLEHLLAKQKKFFATRTTQDVAFRLAKLSELAEAIRHHEQALYTALHTDLHKSAAEVYQGEIYPVLAEIAYATKHLRSWSKPRRVPGPLPFLLSRGTLYRVPRGVALIFSPYNHPVSTSFTPLVSAIAAGNCVILKPSEAVPHAAAAITDIIAEVFSEEHVAVIPGGRENAEALLELSVDTIFFTGSTSVGRVVMETAAQKLIPVTLELGGKCPGIVDATADIARTAARIAWGKFWNAGQSCNTVDYLFVHRSVKDQLVAALKERIVAYYGTDPQKSAHYGRLVNERHFDRVSNYLSEGTILIGGHHDRDDLYIAPTVMEHVPPGARLLEEEIFGPILPLIEYESIEDVLAHLQSKPKTLALYLFSKDTNLVERVLAETESGTACINDLMVQAISPAMPIGGVGDSGFGRMHGKEGFDAFSYTRSVLRQTSLFDPPFRFPPYNEKVLLPLLRRFLR